MNFRPLATAAASAGLAVAGAAEIRDYDPPRHDRFTGFPEAPAWNDAAWFGSRDYSAVGWSTVNPRFQYALVSPRHFVYAAHNAPVGGTILRFLDKQGNLVERGIAAREVIRNADGTATDLALGTLDAPVGESVGFFPVLNLPSDSAYPGTELVVFGWDARAGRSVFDGFHDGVISGTGETRLYKFLYRKNGGSGDDIYLVHGDSGSPTFGLAGGAPALVGTHSAAAENTVTRTSYDTFVPAYLAQLDAAMDPLGHRITRAYPEPVELAAGLETAPATLRQAAAGSATFSISNAAAADAANVRFTLAFPQDAPPDELVAGEGWIVETAGTPAWTLRRGGIDAAESATVTASWDALPTVDELRVSLTWLADGSPLKTREFDLAPAPSYVAWSAGLPDADPAADPDDDEVPNLLEYAFGGDPSLPDRASIMPVFSIDGGRGTLTFPMRTDAELRGISYFVEWSSSLDGWSSDPPPGWTTENVAAGEGFVRRIVSFDASGRLFGRVRVQLDETAD